MSPASTSPIAALKARREQLTQSLHLDLQVPRWSDPEIFVRYGPVATSVLERMSRAVTKAKTERGQAALDANTDLLVRACVGVYAVLDGKQYSLDPASSDGDWTTFDEALGANLGVEDASARKVCQALFLTEGDLLAHSRQLVEWSGFANEQVDEELAGE